MIIEVIILGITLAILLPGIVMAVINGAKLEELREKYKTSQVMMKTLEADNVELRREVADIGRELEVERVNCKMLERVILDGIGKDTEDPREQKEEPGQAEISQSGHWQLH